MMKVVEASPNALVLVNDVGCIELVNAVTERLFGYQRAELLGQTIEMLVPRRFRHHHAVIRGEFSSDPTSRPMGAGRDLFGVRKDGSEVPIEIGLSLLETEHGMMVLSAIVDLSERKLREESILRSLKEKEALLGEIHHRVKNNLQMIDSLLSLQCDKIFEEPVRRVFTDSRNRIKSMALIHQILYQSRNFAEVDFLEFLHRLIPALRESYGVESRSVSITARGTPLFLPIAAAVPSGLIVNELVTNALKHAFPSGAAGDIVVEVGRAADHSAIICVLDNGIGVPPGLNIAETGTLGLQLVTVLTEQLGATLTIGRANPTKFSFCFPIAG